MSSLAATATGGGLSEPILIVLISAGVATVIGYIGVVISVIRRLRAGKLRALTVEISPFFQLRWQAEGGHYELKTPIGSISVGGAPPSTTTAQGYTAKIDELTTKARQTATEFDQAMAQMEEAVGTRTKVIGELEAQLQALKEHEKQLQDRVKTLSAIEPAAAKEFVSLLDADMSNRERQGIRRDLILFVAGVICTIIVSAIFFALS
jgi:hypothetical protein